MNRFTIRRRIAVGLAAMIAVAAATDILADRKRDEKQAALDAACEAAREKKLAPLRKQYIEECVKNKEQPDRQSCEAFYADFGAQSGQRAPLFYDLPECVEAFEFQNSQRQR
jgi:RNA processing factor Prp31